VGQSSVCLPFTFGKIAATRLSTLSLSHKPACGRLECQWVLSENLRNDSFYSYEWE